MTVKVTIAYGDTPPSLNTAGTRGSHWAVNGEKKRWQHILETLLMCSGLPRNLKRVEARAVLRFPARRRRDTGNHSWLLEKALGDALVNGRWIPDDDAARFRLISLEFDPELGAPNTEIIVEAIAA